MSTEPTKLKEEGQSITFTIASAGLLVGPDGKQLGKWPEVEFIGRDGKQEIVLRVPQSAADRQLGRIPLTYAECAGKVLTFSRDHNPESSLKPYWGITLEGTATPHVANPVPVLPINTTPLTKPTTVPGGEADELPADPLARYAHLADWYVANIIPLLKANNIVVTHEGTGAGIATLFIGTR